MSQGQDLLFKLKAQVSGEEQLQAFTRNLKGIDATAKITGADLNALAGSFNRMESSAKGTIAGLRQTAQGLEALRDRARIGSREFAEYNAQLVRTRTELDKVSRSSVTARGSGSGGLGAGGLLAAGAAGAGAFAAYQATQQIGATVNTGIDLEQSRTRLKALSAGFDDYTAVQQRAIQVGEKFNLQQLDANNSFAQLYARLRPLGIELDTITSIYGGFNTAAKLAGTSSTEASAAFIQLSQALGSGVLRGEELNSVYEQTPAVIREIAKVMGLPIGQLREYAKEGKITSDIVITALGNIEREGAQKLAESMNGPREQVALLQREFQELQDEAAGVAMPAIMASIGLLRGVVEGLTGEVQANALAWKGLTESPIGQFFEGIRILVSGLNIDLLGTRRHIDGIVSVIPGLGGLQTLGLWRDNLAGGRSGNGLMPGASGLTLRSSIGDYPSLPTGNATGTRVGAAVGGGGGSGSGAKPKALSEVDRVLKLPYGKQIVAVARANDLPPSLVAGLVETESNFRSDAVSSAGAGGLTQLMPGTAAGLGVRNRFDPLENLRGGARYLRDQINAFGVENGLRAYNQGPGNQQRYPAGVSAEARSYPGKVLANARKYGFGGDTSEMDLSAIDDRERQREEQRKNDEKTLLSAQQGIAYGQQSLAILREDNELSRLGLQYQLEEVKIRDKASEILATTFDERAKQAVESERDLQIEQLKYELLVNQNKAIADRAGLKLQSYDLATAQNGIRGFGMQGNLASNEVSPMGKLQDEFRRLTDPTEVLVNNSKLIGDSFGTMFKDIVSGSQSASQAFANFAKSIADSLLDQATRIIANKIASSLLGMFGGGGAAGLTAFTPGLNLGSSFGGSGFNPAAFTPGLVLNANGNAFGASGMIPFAKGGIVDSPTMFQFAKGGSFRNGIMGEAGPEAILPLRRGPGGALGVAGGGGTSVVVNVNMETGQSDVKSSEGDGQALGRAVSEAVQAELIKQRRAGGSLYR